MGSRSDSLHSAVLSDLREYLPFGPVALGDIPPDASYKQFAAAVLSGTLLKKYVPIDTSTADILAKEKFTASNKKCSDWSLHLDTESDRQLYGEFLREIDNFLHPDGHLLFDSYFDLFEGGRVGPGSALGARGQSLYAKLFASKLTTTSESLYKLYRSYIQWFPIWDDAERQRYSQFGQLSIVDCSRCSFVPKTKDISRMICVEPSLNMFIQLGLGTLLEKRLSNHFSCDLSSQPEVNRRLAYLGSKDGSFATIDLSSASDSISLNLCKEIFPSWFFETLCELRSPNVKLDDTIVPLNMISTMGNGFTFPLQTMIFSCLIRAAYHNTGLPILDGARVNWACFGDDLICDTKAYRNVIRLLSILGFSINSEKSFFEGPFRESCGTDWFFGQPVRGIYIKKLRSPQDLTVAVNLLNTWSAYTGIPLRESVRLLISWLQTVKKRLFVPFDENFDSGIRVPFAIIPRNEFTYDCNKSILYRVMRPQAIFVDCNDVSIRTPKGSKSLIYNSSGLFMSLLYGELVDGRYSVRHDFVKYRSKRRCTPFWDYMPIDRLYNGYTL